MWHDARHPSDETLLRAVDGELSPRRTATLDTHLATCGRCRTRVQAIRSSADDACGACRDETTTPAAPAMQDMRARLLAGLANRSAQLDRSWQFQFARLLHARLPATLAAAALVVIVFAAYLARHELTRFAAKDATAPLEAGALPIRALTPGATEHITADELCAGLAPSRGPIAAAVRQAVLRDYGMEGLPDAEYELDYLITPELGGSSDRRNLWPERYGSRVWNAHVKDELERLLPTLVCRGAIDLTTAQRDIAADWIAAYKKYFHTDRPVLTQARAVSEE
jgi:hypothetical protein